MPEMPCPLPAIRQPHPPAPAAASPDVVGAGQDVDVGERGAHPLLRIGGAAGVDVQAGGDRMPVVIRHPDPKHDLLFREGAIPRLRAVEVEGRFSQTQILYFTRDGRGGMRIYLTD